MSQISSKSVQPFERNRKYRSQQPNLNKLERGPLGTLQTKYEWFLVNGFIEEDFLRIGHKLHKIAHNSMKNRGSTLIEQT